MILTPEELVQITGKQKAPAQARQLAAWGVPYKERKDRSLVVFRDDLVASKQQSAKTPKLRLG